MRTLKVNQLREIKRLLAGAPRAAGIAADRWSRACIGRLVRSRYGVPWGNTYAVRALRERGIVLAIPRARAPRLSAAKRRTLRRLLLRGPSQSGTHFEPWSRAQVAALIEQRFRVRYSLQHIGRLLRALQLPPAPARRAPRLGPAQAERLRQLLHPQDGAVGAAPPPCTRERVAAIILEHFGIRYSPHSMARLLERLGIAVHLVRCGPRGRLTPEQRHELAEALGRTPSECGLSGSLWTQHRIAGFIQARFGCRYRPYNVHRMLARGGLRITHRAARGGVPLLNADQLSILRAALAAPPATSGFSASRWTRQRVADLIRQRWSIDYAPTSIPGLLRRCGLRLRPSHSAPLAMETPSTPHQQKATELFNL
jgi:transposase